MFYDMWSYNSTIVHLDENSIVTLCTHWQIRRLDYYKQKRPESPLVCTIYKIYKISTLSK